MFLPNSQPYTPKSINGSNFYSDTLDTPEHITKALAPLNLATLPTAADLHSTCEQVGLAAFMCPSHPSLPDSAVLNNNKRVHKCGFNVFLFLCPRRHNTDYLFVVEMEG